MRSCPAMAKISAVCKATELSDYNSRQFVLKVCRRSDHLTLYLLKMRGHKENIHLIKLISIYTGPTHDNIHIAF